MEPSSKTVNGIDVAELRGYVEKCYLDPSQADRNPQVIARWVGGTRAEVVSTQGGAPVYMGGDEDPSAMGMLLRTLAACDIEVVVNTCSLLGLEIEELTIEATGYFNVARYLGLDSAGGPGYQRASYTINLKVPGATFEQLDKIRQACRDGSPVGDTLERNVEVSMELVAS